MAEEKWEDILAKKNREARTEPGEAIPAKRIVDSMKEAGMSDSQIASLLRAYMRDHPLDTLEPAAPAVAEPLTLEKVLSMVNTPQELKKAWDSSSQEVKEKIIAQIAAAEAEIRTTATATTKSSTPAATRQYKTGDIVTAKNSQRYQRIENPATKQIQWKNLATNKLMALPVAKQLGLNESMNLSDSRVVDVRPLIKKALAKK